MRHRLLLIFLVLTAAGAPAAAQDPVLGPDTMPVADTIPDEAPVPRNAFIRALLVPGWGHVYVDEHRRGGVYFALQSASWYMLLKTVGRLGEARELERRFTGFARDSLEAAMAADTALARELSDPQAYDEALAAYPGLQHRRDLVNSRERHRQDWIVYTAVFTFASAVDAYVTAHLRDFPGHLATGYSRTGGVLVQLTLPVGGRR